MQEVCEVGGIIVTLAACSAPAPGPNRTATRTRYSQPRKIRSKYQELRCTLPLLQNS